jgi:hypothetical protein
MLIQNKLEKAITHSFDFVTHDGDQGLAKLWTQSRPHTDRTCTNADNTLLLSLTLEA